MKPSSTPYNKMKRLPPLLGTLAAATAAAIMLAACDVGSVDSTTSSVSDSSGAIYDFSGLYASPGESILSTNKLSNIVHPSGKQTGQKLTWLRLTQYGSKLEGFDNAGMNWKGNVSPQAAQDSSGVTANFNLSGRTSVGSPVEIVGAFHLKGTNSAINAAWLEPGFSGNIIAQATVSGISSNATPNPSPTNGTNNISSGVLVSPEKKATANIQ